MHKLVIKLGLLFFLLLPVAVQAQTTLHLGSVSVDLWPEYDQPGVLVIYHLELTGGTSLPAALQMRIPAAAQVNAVAIVDPNKGLVNAPYQNTVQGDWATLSITTNSLQVQVEYYVGLNKNGTTRHIEYVWPGDNPVDTLEVNFLLPPAANLVKIDPSPLSNAPGQGGLTNYLVRTANPPVGQSFIVTIEYERQTDELGIASLPVQAISTPGANTPGHASTSSVLSWVLGGLGVLLVVGGVVGFIGLRRSSHAPARRNKHSTPIVDETGSESIYCSECGKRAQPGDIFCRTCGARLKKSEPDQ